MPCPLSKAGHFYILVLLPDIKTRSIILIFIIHDDEFIKIILLHPIFGIV